jgi:hypothetical protein
VMCTWHVCVRVMFCLVTFSHSLPTQSPGAWAQRMSCPCALTQHQSFATVL